MADRLAAHWTPERAWSGILAGSLADRPVAPAGVVVEPRDGLRLATIIARAEGIAALRARIKSRFGAELSTSPRVAPGPDCLFLWSGQGRWLALAERADLVSRLTAEAGDLAAISDQSSSRALLRLTGPRVRDALAKGCPLDLHDRAFGPGDVALTAIAHIGVQLWRVDSGAFEIAVARSYRESFWRWLSASAAEYGCEVRGPSDVHSVAPQPSRMG